MHVHFGMSGRWSVADARRAPEPTPTTRLVLEGNGLVSHLSAMTVDYGTVEVPYEPARRARSRPCAATPTRTRCGERSAPRPSPSAPCSWTNRASRASATSSAPRSSSWPGSTQHAGEGPHARAVRHNLGRERAADGRAFALGSIVTVSPEEAAAVGKPSLRRWIYNSARCGKCGHGVKSWDIQSRTCYACERCQPRTASDGASGTPASTAAPRTLFNSHCAAESLEERLKTPVKLRVAELRAALSAAGLPTDGKKAVLVERLQAHMDAKQSDAPPVPAAMARGDAMRRAVSAALAELDAPPSRGAGRPMVMRSARAAAADKAAVNGSRARSSTSRSSTIWTTARPSGSRCPPPAAASPLRCRAMRPVWRRHLRAAVLGEARGGGQATTLPMGRQMRRRGSARGGRPRRETHKQGAWRMMAGQGAGGISQRRPRAFIYHERKRPHFTRRIVRESYSARQGYGTVSEARACAAVAGPSSLSGPASPSVRGRVGRPGGARAARTVDRWGRRG